MQRDEEWFARRLGKVTGSRIGDVMATTRSGYGAAREKYIAQLVLERLTGSVAPSFQSGAMQWGVEQEDAARASYELETAQDVEEVDFVDHPRIKNAGMSPDGRVGQDGLLEIKCPESHTHLATLLGAPIDRRYMLQMQWQMDCDDREWCDFVSFDPRFPPALQLHIQRVERDQDLINEIGAEVMTALAHVDERYDNLLALMDDGLPGFDDLDREHAA